MDAAEREAHEIAENWERLTRPAPDGERAEPGDPLGRELAEAGALLAWGLEPERPRPEARARLLARLGPPAVAAVAAAPVVDLAEYRRRERRGWQAARLLAAALLLAVGGVVYLAGRLDAESARFAEAAARNTALERRDAERAAALEVAGRRIHMITSVARYAYRLESVTPAFAAAEGRAPQGMVYVCGHHQQWILSLEHLAPPPPGSEYHVRFHTAGGEVDGGVLAVGDDARAGMEDVKLPPETRGFAVTLEPAGSAGDPLLVLQSQPGVPL